MKFHGDEGTHGESDIVTLWEPVRVIRNGPGELGRRETVLERDGRVTGRPESSRSVQRN